MFLKGETTVAKGCSILLKTIQIVKFQSFFWGLAFFCSLTAILRGERGIVVALCDRYAEYFIPSLAHLRLHLDCQLPIEIWHSGDELSEEVKQKIRQFSNVTFCDIAAVLRVSQTEYRGWHIKPWTIWLSSFDEVLLMDADVYFFENPEQLFSHKGYVETGAFFFRDRTMHTFPANWEGDDRFTIETYLKRRSFFRSLIRHPSSSLPREWRHYWEEVEPSKERPFISDHQESGCIAFDKRRHDKGIGEIVLLNLNRKETYQYVYGDKETYWMGLEIAKEPYYMNPEVALTLSDKTLLKEERFIDIVQFLDGRLFFQQKHPFKVSKRAKVFNTHPRFSRSISSSERQKILFAAYTREAFKS